MRRWLATVALVAAAGAQAQPAPPACPAPKDVAPRSLVGLWRAEFEGRGPAGTVLLEPHREYTETLSGAINRDGARSAVVADLEDGDFTMEESPDGKRIAATWLGTITEGSCGREIRGTRSGGWDGKLPFVLRRAD